MTKTRAIPAILAVLVLLGGAWLTPSAEGSAPHLTLLSSSPAADTVVVASPDTIRLHFSEPPRIRGTTVRLTDAANELVASTGAAANAEDAKEVFIRPDRPLAPGAYTVHWRVIAQDGHTQRGEFSFQVGGTAAR
ncbi:copper homeostasis periplasmic binding protein CopC [soil metagenome]